MLRFAFFFAVSLTAMMSAQAQTFRPLDRFNRDHYELDESPRSGSPYRWLMDHTLGYRVQFDLEEIADNGTGGGRRYYQYVLSNEVLACFRPLVVKISVVQDDGYESQVLEIEHSRRDRSHTRLVDDEPAEMVTVFAEWGRYSGRKVRSHLLLHTFGEPSEKELAEAQRQLRDGSGIRLYRDAQKD